MKFAVVNFSVMVSCVFVRLARYTTIKRSYNKTPQYSIRKQQACGVAFTMGRQLSLPGVENPNLYKFSIQYSVTYKEMSLPTGICLSKRTFCQIIQIHRKLTILLIASLHRKLSGTHPTLKMCPTSGSIW